ncbi:hypothetical protein ACFP51_08940 [Streptomyces pratens]|uniref:PD40 domain-containing protein n=1 Tax=Streptomyces pratens TaxID=887456 RepID=A0ABW1LQW5_9ACTN
MLLRCCHQRGRDEKQQVVKPSLSHDGRRIVFVAAEEREPRGPALDAYGRAVAYDAVPVVCRESVVRRW